MKVDNQSITCDFCLSQENDFIGYKKDDRTFSISKKDTYGIYQCKACSLYFTFPKPALNEIKDFFSIEYFNVRFQKSLYDVLKRYPKRESLSYKIKPVKRYIKRIAQEKDSYSNLENCLKKYLNASDNKTLLEIGPGTAPLFYLEHYGYRYMGLEPSIETVTIFNEKGYHNIKQGFAEKMDFIDTEQIDAIICVGSLSHVSDIKGVFLEFSRVIKKGGIIVINDNNADVDIYNNISGSYTYYAFSKDFLSNSLQKYNFQLLDYFPVGNHGEIDPRGSKIFAILKKVNKEYLL